jgi:hypothetical protein
MQLIILGQVYEFDNATESIPLIISKTQQITESTKMVLSHMIIDDQEIYEDFDGYLHDNILEMKKLEIILINFEHMFSEMVHSASDYLERALPAINILANDFYQTPTEDTWARFAQLLDGLSWLTECMELFNEYSQEKVQLGEYKEKLSELEDAVKNNDLVLVGDLLTYEVLPILENFKTSVDILLAERDDADVIQ